MKTETRRCWIYVLEMDIGVDVIVRALAQFPGQGAEITRLNLQTDGPIACLEIQAESLADDRAEQLRLSLAQLAGIRHLSCGLRQTLGHGHPWRHTH